MITCFHSTYCKNLKFLTLINLFVASYSLYDVTDKISFKWITTVKTMYICISKCSFLSKLFCWFVLTFPNRFNISMCIMLNLCKHRSNQIEPDTKHNTIRVFSMWGHALHMSQHFSYVFVWQMPVEYNYNTGGCSEYRIKSIKHNGTLRQRFVYFVPEKAISDRAGAIHFANICKFDVPITSVCRYGTCLEKLKKNIFHFCVK